MFEAKDLTSPSVRPCCRWHRWWTGVPWVMVIWMARVPRLRLLDPSSSSSSSSSSLACGDLLNPTMPGDWGGRVINPSNENERQFWPPDGSRGQKLDCGFLILRLCYLNILPHLHVETYLTLLRLGIEGGGWSTPQMKMKVSFDYQMAPEARS